MSPKPTILVFVVGLAGGLTAAAEHSVLCNPPFRPISDLLGAVCAEIDRPLIGPPHWHPVDGKPGRSGTGNGGTAAESAILDSQSESRHDTR